MVKTKQNDWECHECREKKSYVPQECFQFFPKRRELTQKQYIVWRGIVIYLDKWPKWPKMAKCFKVAKSSKKKEKANTTINGYTAHIRSHFFANPPPPLCSDTWSDTPDGCGHRIGQNLSKKINKYGISVFFCGWPSMLRTESGWSSTLATATGGTRSTPPRCEVASRPLPGL